MLREVGVCVFVLLIIGCVSSKQINESSEQIKEVANMKLSSPVFDHGGKIPSKYTCDGENVNPPLVMSGIPAGTKSMALLMDDPDIPDAAKKNYNIEVWDHWVIFNMPPIPQSITEGKVQGILGRNTRGKNEYGGPCPPDREHRYFFKLYALDMMLPLSEGASKKEVEEAMRGHIIAQAELMGRYERT